MKNKISLEELKLLIPDKGEMIGDLVMGISLILLSFSVFSHTISLKWGFLVVGFMCVMRVIDKVRLSQKINKIIEDNSAGYYE